MDFRQIQMLRLPNNTPKRRAWAQLPMNTGYAPSLVVVEWRLYKQMNVVGQIKAALQIKVEALVKMLQQRPKPPGFRILDCLGYLEGNQIPRFGLVFRYPHLNANQGGLRLAETCSIPSLWLFGHIIKVAISLVKP